MFWRFGFHNASAIDSLLDKEDVTLEAILDEDDLLQECKAQNTRLSDYFQRVDVLQKLLAYVTGQIENDDRARFRYPYIATEVLCSEIWSIVETCVNEQKELLIPFWETVLDTPPEEMKTQMVMASHFAKINAVFLSKKPAEMLAFMQSQPSAVERLLRHVETPSFVDLLIRIIQLDEQPGGNGVLEWLSSENLMSRLIDLISPEHTSDVHTVVAELIKGIISMAAPSPGVGLTEGLQNGPASNRFARELAHKDSIAKLISYILNDYNALKNGSTTEDKTKTIEHDIISIDDENPHLPTPETVSSSVIHSICIIIELMRKNNSDFFEPYLFHILRNRLIQVQQHLHGDTEDNRNTLEQAMKEMVDKMGVVHLGPLLEVMCEKLVALQDLLKTPRFVNGPIPTTVGPILPLTFERYRLCELFAELLHCSNMALLNRGHQHDHLYDSEGRLQGGLAGLDELSQIISPNDLRERDAMDETNDEVEPALELPISRRGQDSLSMSSGSDISDDEPGSSDDDVMEEIAMYDEPNSNLEFSPMTFNTPLPPSASPTSIASSQSSATLIDPPQPTSSTPTTTNSRSPNKTTTQDSSSTHRAHGSRRSSKRMATMESSLNLPMGEHLKRRMLDIGLFSTLLDLFFEFPWNNFLHGAVYDFVHQILTGRVENGLNRELAVALFRDARLMDRIIEGQRRNDEEATKPKGVRLGYMGHLTLIAEDIIVALERFPPGLAQLITSQYTPPEWGQYISGRFNETKSKDSALLGGGKPIINVNGGGGPGRGGASWKVDEEMSSDGGNTYGGGETRGEFRRGTNGPGRPTNTADFGSVPMNMDDDDDDEDGTPHQFARYLAQEMHGATGGFGSESDDEDEEGGWLSQSTFTLNNPPLSARVHQHQTGERRPLGFDDVFTPVGSSMHSMADDAFNAHDDDGFGPFSDSAAVSHSDPFTFPSSFSADEIEDSSFDNFGDFGDFQSATATTSNSITNPNPLGSGPAAPANPGTTAEVNGFGSNFGDDYHGGVHDREDTSSNGGDLTPTAGSWTFASGSVGSIGSADSSLSEDQEERNGTSSGNGSRRSESPVNLSLKDAATASVGSSKDGKEESKPEKLKEHGRSGIALAVGLKERLASFASK
ncbi:SAPS-domain-containing protein [Pluteus cervinus]|uniref:SAPS-domain-containing protein n=1 Tax=Pluteus cervinus TaxID=181527 RepID=A0ACD3ASI3_9AGAR|nr:SAPS-domain-containing protein [Pluteus cervinus]